MLCRLNILVLWFLVLLVIPGSTAVRADAQARTIGIAERIVGEVYGNGLLRRLRTGEDVYENQKVSSGADGAAALQFRDRSRLTIGPDSEIVLDRFVYDPDVGASQGTINLLRGVLRFTSAALDRGIKFKTSSAVIGIRGTAIEMFADGDVTEVVVQEGEIEVTSRQGSVIVHAGQSITVGRGGAIRSGSGRSVRFAQAIERMAALTGVLSDQRAAVRPAQAANPSPHASDATVASIAPGLPASDASTRPARPESRTGASVASRSAARERADEAAAVRGKDPRNLLYLDLSFGRVIIEMRPDLAPHHVARIKQLVRSGFYNGLAFHAVLPGRFAMTGDPTGTGRGGSGTSLAAELSAAPFHRGSVGMAHDQGQPDSADSQFFIALDTFPEVDGKYTLWGQVIYGMANIERLHTGNPPTQPDRVVRMALGSDMAG